MKTLIKLDLNKLISNKLLFLLFGLTIFSMDERITQTLSSQQFILYIFTEHYYLTYLMMPIFMLSIYSSLGDDMEYILIRSTLYITLFLLLILHLYVPYFSHSLLMGLITTE